MSEQRDAVSAYLNRGDSPAQLIAKARDAAIDALVMDPTWHPSWGKDGVADREYRREVATRIVDLVLTHVQPWNPQLADAPSSLSPALHEALSGPKARAAERAEEGSEEPRKRGIRRPWWWWKERSDAGEEDIVRAALDNAIHLAEEGWAAYTDDYEVMLGAVKRLEDLRRVAGLPEQSDSPEEEPMSAGKPRNLTPAERWRVPMPKLGIKARLAQTRDHIRRSDDAGGNEMEHRELRYAVLELTEAVEALRKKSSKKAG